MDEEFIQSKSEIVNLDDLQSDFLTLRIGEEIPRLNIKQIRKVINKTKQDNLSGVDYKYLIETKNNKILKVNSWVLWNKIASVLKEAGSTEVDLEIKHSGMEDYSVRVI